MNEDVETGLHRATVTLDDGRLTTEYFLYVYVKAKVADESSEEDEADQSGNDEAPVNEDATDGSNQSDSETDSDGNQ